MVERCLAKAKVEGSNPFFRLYVWLSNRQPKTCFFFLESAAEVDFSLFDENEVNFVCCHFVLTH